MALKPHRIEDPFAQDISFYMDEVAERGGVAVLLTAGSGDGWKTVMGDTRNVVTYAAGPAGKKPIGFLLNDMVPVEATTGYTRNYGLRDEMPVGSKCTLLKRGELHTNKVTGTPVGGDPMHLGSGGNVTTNTAEGVRVGTFLGSKDSDGYVRVHVNIT
jgi:hypothetical protein